MAWISHRVGIVVGFRLSVAENKSGQAYKDQEAAQKIDTERGWSISA